jgi:hypothetical protein
MNERRLPSRTGGEIAAPLDADAVKPAHGQLPCLNKMERIREIHRLIRMFTRNPDNDGRRGTDESLAEQLEVTDCQIRRDGAVLERLIDERDTQSGHGGKESALQFDKRRRS